MSANNYEPATIHPLKCESCGGEDFAHVRVERGHFNTSVARGNFFTLTTVRCVQCGTHFLGHQKDYTVDPSPVVTWNIRPRRD
jgi:uncharacterized Zn finger protein